MYKKQLLEKSKSCFTLNYLSIATINFTLLPKNFYYIAVKIFIWTLRGFLIFLIIN